MDFRRLDIVAIGAGIADVRIGERDNLATIGRIRKDLLIARHRGIKNHFADGLPIHANRRAVKNSPVL